MGRELNQALLREEEGLVGERGLVVNNQGRNAEWLNQNQVFTMFVTADIRKTYESKMLRQVAQVRGCQGLVSAYLLAYCQGVFSHSSSFCSRSQCRFPA